MAYYDKKIVYLSYMEHGQRMSGAGFIKLEEYDTYAAIEVMVKGLGKNINKKPQVLIINERGEAKPVGSIEIKHGEGRWSGRTEKSSAAAAAIKINLEDGKVVESKLREYKQSEEKEVQKKEVQKKEIQKKETMLKTAEYEENNRPKGREEKPGKKWDIGAERDQVQGQVQSPVDMEQVIFTDKWKQLMQLYPVVHPYEDSREYISIEPKDFVVMSGNYQHLANNSFLLHGFYNYRHVILGKEKGGETELVYLGVPGVYYEREKMVALMFGFEAFECAGGLAQQGKFGYYLRQVQL